MVVRLNRRSLLQLRGARGVGIRVLDGAVWITEPNRDDRFVVRGGLYRVAGDGLVIVESEAAGDPAAGPAELRFES
jgi:hypothetical protein